MDKFDDLFFGILQNCEQIEPFLEVVLSFLARRTDFFRVMHNKTDKMGFPPGVAEKMLLKVQHTKCESVKTVHIHYQLFFVFLRDVELITSAWVIQQVKPSLNVVLTPIRAPKQEMM